MTFIEVLLNVLAIIGIVAVGGFVIYFLGGVVLSILESKKKEQTTEKFEEEAPVSQYQPEAEASYEDTLTDEKFMLEDDEKVESVDYAKATEEKRSLNETQEVEKQEEIAPVFDEDKEFNFEDFDFDAFFNEQNEALDLQPKAEEPVQDVKVEDETLVLPQPIAEPAVEEVKVQEEAPVAQPEPVIEEPVVVQEPVVEEIQPAPVASVAETAKTESIVAEKVETNVATETTKTVYIENTELENALREEIATLKAELAEQKALYEALKTESQDNQKKWEEEKTTLEALYADAEKRQEELNAKSKEALSIEEYEARLEVLRERLKANEFELRANRKEFLPLKKVRKNLDKDKSKLRRREALVAKQKVLLYGVNNISEIDQEKAKKLAEDLDLLDGLKVSVRHCEEVMEANKERYPILETANRILITTNEELKADILACETAIRKLKGEDVDGMSLEQITLASKPAKRGRGRPRKVQTTEKPRTNDICFTKSCRRPRC